ncbi:MAG: hypothetical protein AAF926_04620, partial [Pseudomonadota bacterium]
MVQQAFVTSMDAVSRFNRLAELLGLDNDVRRGIFDGTVYGHALPYFEAMFRWATVGRSQPDGDQVKKSLERGMHDIWPRNQRIQSRLMLLIAEVVAYTAKISYPISEWTIQELMDEYVRLDTWREVYGIIAGIGSTVGLGRTGIGLAAATGIQGAQKLASVIGPAGLAISAGSAVIAAIAYWQCTRVIAEIEEEI